MTNSIIISVEGNIGSGKSTLIKYLKNHLSSFDGYKIIYLQEPVDIWESIHNKDGKNVIECYYENQKKYAFQFQMMAYITRITQLRKTVEENNNCIIITERSILTDRNVFAKMLYDNETLDKVSHEIYLKWFNELSRGLEIHSYIYIHTSPLTSSERIIKRNRKGEIVPLEYLQTCHEYHEDWLNKEKMVIKLNGEQNYKNDIPPEWLFIIKSHLSNEIQHHREKILFHNIQNYYNQPMMPIR